MCELQLKWTYVFDVISVSNSPYKTVSAFHRLWLHKSGVFNASPEGINRRSVTHNYSHKVAELSDKLEATQLRSEIFRVNSKQARLFLNLMNQEFYLSIYLISSNEFDFNISFCRVQGSWRQANMEAKGGSYKEWPRSGAATHLEQSRLWFVVFTTKDIAIVRYSKTAFEAKKLNNFPTFILLNWSPLHRNKYFVRMFVSCILCTCYYTYLHMLLIFVLFKFTLDSKVIS